MVCKGQTRLYHPAMKTVPYLFAPAGFVPALSCSMKQLGVDSVVYAPIHRSDVVLWPPSDGAAVIGQARVRGGEPNADFRFQTACELRSLLRLASLSSVDWAALAIHSSLLYVWTSG